MRQGAVAQMHSAAGVGESGAEAGAGVGGAVKGGVTVEIPKVGAAVGGGTLVAKVPELTQEEKDKLEEVSLWWSVSCAGMRVFMDDARGVRSKDTCMQYAVGAVYHGSSLGSNCCYYCCPL